MNMLFNTLPVIKDLNDFVIIRYDFKSFFDSVATQFIYNSYIEKSSIPRATKKIFVNLSNNFKYCYAGLNTSNAMTEIACRDFDKVLRAKLETFGVVFCQRYVDDALVILNSYISEQEFRKLLNTTIKEVFLDCKVKVNESKFNYIARRNISSSQNLDFLGYNFTIEYDTSRKQPFIFKFGITTKKQEKYKSKISQAFVEYRSNGNVELLRHRVKAFSSRVVYTSPLNKENSEWITKGIIANYNELRYHLDDLDDNTEEFLKNIYYEIMAELGINKIPYFFNINDIESSYILYSTMRRNRSMIFDPKIGIKINHLVQQIRKIEPTYVVNKRTYYQITKDYLDLLKIQ